METVAFYSYKGGDARSLLLADAARFLAGLGLHVVAVDFDLAAPGLHYKFGTARDSNQMAGGVVPYLIATSAGTASPPPLDEHMQSVRIPAAAGGWLRIMPAGVAPQHAYWAQLKQLGERLALGDPSGRSFMALLDLQARVADELQPGYLLIDAGAGVTEFGGLATAVLADTVVCMLEPNQESLDGTLAVAEALAHNQRLGNQKPIRIAIVVSGPLGNASDDEWLVSKIMRLHEVAGGESAVRAAWPSADLFHRLFPLSSSRSKSA